MTKRVKVAFCVVLVLVFALIVRIGILSVDEDIRLVGMNQSGRNQVVAETRGTIYDRNGVPLVNESNRYFAVLAPQERLLERISDLVSPSDYLRLREGLNNSALLTTPLTGIAGFTEGLMVLMAPERYNRTTQCPHILGQLDGSNQHGVSGVEKAFDSLLRQYGGKLSVTYTVDAKGQINPTEEWHVTNTVDRCRGGVTLTIDSSIQKAVESIGSQHLTKGAIVVMDPKNGDILASASYPTFRLDQLEDSLDDPDSPMVNRAFSSYDCGSIFKIVTALAALESGISINQTYECNGAMAVDQTIFHCHYRLGHQQLTMEEAFSVSCNLYFIQLAQAVGAEKVLEIANKLGLGSAISLANEWATAETVLPSLSDLSSPAALANLSFGQGKLLLTPLHIARMTSAVINNGTLPNATIVLATTDGEESREYAMVNGEGETVLSAASVQSVQSMMERVVSTGTGTAAQIENATVGGKTGTAETGQIQDDRAVIHSWFTGYVISGNRPYVITVLVEDHQSDHPTAAQLFQLIATKLQS